MKEEKTLVILKPDSVQRTLIGEIIQRFEKVGLKLVAMKMLSAPKERIEKHYSVDPNWKKNVGERVLENLKNKGESVEGKTAEAMGTDVLERLIRYMSAGPIVVLALQGSTAIKLTRKLVGTTEPLTSDVGTIRGDFVLDSYHLADIDSRAIRNLIHASSSTEEALKELPIWFDEEEYCDYCTVHEKILYDINFDNEKE